MCTPESRDARVYSPAPAHSRRVLEHRCHAEEARPRLTPGTLSVSWSFDARCPSMTTRLSGVLKRELAINGEAYTVTISQEGFALTLKGRRKGLELRWADLVSGDAALATALNASLVMNIRRRDKPAEKPPSGPKPAARPKLKPAAKSPDTQLRPASPKTKSRAASSSRLR